MNAKLKTKSYRRALVAVYLFVLLVSLYALSTKNSGYGGEWLTVGVSVGVLFAFAALMLLMAKVQTSFISRMHEISPQAAFEGVAIGSAKKSDRAAMLEECTREQK